MGAERLGSLLVLPAGKYARVLREAGSWPWLQRLLAVLKAVADKHGTSVSNVAAKWVLGRPAVPAVILGARNARHVPVRTTAFSSTVADGRCWRCHLKRIQCYIRSVMLPVTLCTPVWCRGGMQDQQRSINLMTILPPATEPTLI